MTSRSGSLGLEAGVVRLVEYDPDWPARFDAEAATIGRAVAARGLPPLRLEHVGSTSVPGMIAKPVLDIAAGRAPGTSPEAYIAALVSVGYVYRPDAEIPGRDFLRRGEPRSYHVHMVEMGGPLWREYLDFRDTLRSVPSLAAAYAAVKTELARRYPTDRESYTHGKTEIVAGILGRPPARG